MPDFPAPGAPSPAGRQAMVAGAAGIPGVSSGEPTLERAYHRFDVARPAREVKAAVVAALSEGGGLGEMHDAPEGDGGIAVYWWNGLHPVTARVAVTPDGDGACSVALLVECDDSLMAGRGLIWAGNAIDEQLQGP